MRRTTDNHGQIHRAAFTLMELLVVIAIMAIISTVAVSGYFGLMRAASYSAAHDNVYNTLALTRQRAVIDGKVTSFMILNATNYVVVRAAGRISHFDKDNYAFDAYSALSNAVSQANKRIEIYNLDADPARAGKSKQVLILEVALTLEDPTLPSTDPDFRYVVPGFRFEGTGKDFFAIGDRYGFALHAQQALPRGYLFKDYPGEVRFNNDGSCAEEKTVIVEETIRKQNSIALKIKISGTIEDNSAVQK